MELPFFILLIYECSSSVPPVSPIHATAGGPGSATRPTPPPLSQTPLSGGSLASNSMPLSPHGAAPPMHSINMLGTFQPPYFFPPLQPPPPAPSAPPSLANSLSLSTSAPLNGTGASGSLSNIANNSVNRSHTPNHSISSPSSNSAVQGGGGPSQNSTAPQPHPFSAESLIQPSKSE